MNEIMNISVLALMGFILNYDNSILGFLLFQNYTFLAQNTVNAWYMVRSPSSQKQLNEWFGQSKFLYIPCTLKKQVQINLKQDNFNNERGFIFHETQVQASNTYSMLLYICGKVGINSYLNDPLLARSINVMTSFEIMAKTMLLLQFF